MLAKDPVCGMDIELEDPFATRNSNSQTFNFCSENCVKQFDANPQKFSSVVESSQRSIAGSATTGYNPSLPGPVQIELPIAGRNIVPHAVIWTFTRPVKRVQPGDRLTVRTNCPGVLTWQVEGGQPQQADLIPAGGAMAAVQRYHLTLGPLSYADQEVRFRFRCTHRNCDGREICCNGEEHAFQIKQPAPRRE